ncbi:MAG: translation elongation factor Ts [Bacteroidota bacterium]|nr:translation elongation factor Ts [Bacteroidota bacterium]MDP4205683.1 translation elongation factor Ts [Bacteroidota bacterium]
MSVSASDVMKLRNATGAGMMDCKKALVEANGDFDRAIEVIRERGKLIASKRADREATEGVVLARVSDDKKFGAVVVLNCETDFVAKNEGFVTFAGKILDLAIANKAASLEAVKALELEGRTVEAYVMEQTGIIGEKLDLSYFANVEAETVVAYIHPGNKLATAVGFNLANVDEHVAKDVAMQVAAMSPVSVDKDDVPADVIEQELRIAKEKFRLEGKPENMIEKIAQGSLQKFFKENTLLNQGFIKEGKMTVRDYLKSVSGDLTVTSFKRFTLNQ